MKHFNVEFRDESIINFTNFVETVFNKSIDSLAKDFGFQTSDLTYPKVNAALYPDKLVVTAEIAGISKEDIKITTDNDLLIIEGKNVKKQDSNIIKFFLKELKHSSFKRSFKIDTKIFDLSKVKADFNNGILDITVLKKIPEEKKTTEVKIN